MIVLSVKDIVFWFSSMSILLMNKHGNIHDEERILNHWKRERKNEWVPSTGKLTSISYVNCMGKFISFPALGHWNSKQIKYQTKKKTFGTSVQLLGFSFLTCRIGMFQEPATQCAVCKSAPWVLPGSCLETGTFRPPPSRDFQTQSTSYNKIPSW